MLRVLVTTFLLLTFSLPGHAGSLYDDLGGEKGIATVVDFFITEISFDPAIYPFFSNTDADRLRRTLNEQFCYVSDGPCVYTGDSMEAVHANMHITKGQFDRVVELLQTAMDKADIPFAAQNRLLKELVPMRPQIIER